MDPRVKPEDDKKEAMMTKGIMFKKLLHYIGLALIVSLIMVVIMWRGMFMGVQKGIQNKFYDFDSASSEIIVVSIDENSLKEENLGPLQKWKRAYYSQAIEKLNEKNASVIGLDITLPDTSTHGIRDDKVLANTLKKYDNVVLANRYYFENGGKEIEDPNKTIMEANPNAGWINVHLDSDGFVRMIPIFNFSGNKVIESFSLQIARIYDKLNPIDYVIRDNQFRFSENINIPVITERDNINDEDVHLMYINYFAKPYSFRHISFSNLLDNNLIDKNGEMIDFNNKIVLIGPTAVDLQDDYLSPVSEGVRMPGVEIHANNIQTIISQKFLQDQSNINLLIILVLILIFNVWIFSFIKVRYSTPIVLIEMITAIVSGFFYYENGIIINTIYPISMISLSFIGTFLLRLILEQKDRKFIEGAFGHYVNESVVKQLIKNPKMLHLGGAKREITVLFSDIAGFTTISETMDAEKLVKFLNEYLQEMTKIVLDHEGTLDKYEGDAIMAFWGAPLEMKNHAFKACLAALENQKKLSDLRKKWKKEGKPEIHIRIGINTGEAIVGNMGSENRFDYTAIGDNINLGSRLEGISKEYGTEIIISEATYEQVKDNFICRELDKIRVKGKNNAIRIYELIDKKENTNENQKNTIITFEKALELYRNRDFLSAKKLFEELKDDSPSEIFKKRCEECLANTPSDDWDGVYTFTTK